MAVKLIQSASRVLDVMEAVACHQPVGVSELARLLDADKSAVQRAIMTLADSGWIQRATIGGGEWRLTSRLHCLSQQALGRVSLREVARPTLEELRDLTGETAALMVLENDRLIISDVAESRALLRIAPQAGTTAPLRESASGCAIFAHLPAAQIERLWGAVPDAAQMQAFADCRRTGFAISENPLANGAVTVAAPVFEADGYPVAAILLVAPLERLAADRIAEAGRLVARAAASISRGSPSVAPRNQDAGKQISMKEESQEHGTH